MQSNQFDHVVLLAHGSPDPLWKAPFESLFERVSQRYGNANISLAYMELTEPTLEEAIKALPESDSNVAVLPLFLAVGRHLRKDVPAQIAALQHDGLTIELLAPIGDNPNVQTAMQTAIGECLKDII
ncbi:sirohydrochlorin chelatase [Marinomonas epiphytica]